MNYCKTKQYIYIVDLDKHNIIKFSTNERNMKQPSDKVFENTENQLIGVTGSRYLRFVIKYK